jgi:hypothetical protein
LSTQGPPDAEISKRLLLAIQLTKQPAPHDGRDCGPTPASRPPHSAGERKPEFASLGLRHRAAIGPINN